VLKTIVVALDGSDLSEQVIQTVQELQLQPDSQIILCHVIPPPVSDLDMAADLPHAYAAEIPYRNIEKQIAAYRDKLPGESQVEIVSGDPAEEIVRIANIYQADLIAIGSRGLQGVKRIIQGSVSSQVVESAHCSVLVVKPTT
jgi:nucleotide-binding universal stress UspA family protein